MGSNSTTSIEVLDKEHRDSFVTALSRLLTAELTEETMAQLVDGLPAFHIWVDSWSGGRNLRGDHPIKKHRELCEGVLDKTRKLRDEFDPEILQFKYSLCKSFEDTTVGSKEFGLRLLEMLATAIHAIAVYLYNSDDKSHPKDEIEHVTLWQEPVRRQEFMPGEWETIEPLQPNPTMFYFAMYDNLDEYPNGLADAVGYWAEDRVFGGVVLFDRGKSGKECKDVYIHPGRFDFTPRIWQLTQQQLEAIMDFLLGSSDETPFPVCCDGIVTQRHDDYDAMKYHNIYRDPWERKLPKEKDHHAYRLNTADYPELQSWFDEVTKGPFVTIPREELAIPGLLPTGKAPDNRNVDTDEGYFWADDEGRILDGEHQSNIDLTEEDSETEQDTTSHKHANA